MKKRTLVLGIIVLLNPAVACAQMHVDDLQELFHYTLVYADSAGISHFEDASYLSSDFDVGHGVTALTSGPIPGDGIQLFCFKPGTVVDWHPAPRRQLYLILRGYLDLEVSDGEVRRFRAGDIIVAEATEGKGVRAVWDEAGTSCVGVMPLRNKWKISQEKKASGMLTPVGPPNPAPVRVDVGESCIVDLTQTYTLSGTLSGTVIFNYRILVKGPCGAPAGTYDEEWIAYGEFDGKVDGKAMTGKMSYVAKVKAGGEVDGQIVLGKGLAGELSVRGNFGDRRLSYDGWVDQE